MLFCKHEWKMLSEITTKSKYESSMEIIKKSGLTKTTLPWQLCDASRQHIQTFVCNKCGKLKRFVEEI